MGVPGLFSNLRYKYNKRLIYSVNTAVNDVLMFDFNCLIHPICRLVWLELKNQNIALNTQDFESKVIEKSIEYMEEKINEVKPTKICGIFIDGVCPMTKITHQRQRRFASILDKEIMNNIKCKHSVEKDEYYDTNAITPGTAFMEKFHLYLLNYVENKNKAGKADDMKFIYSSYKCVGEGEHKIIKYIIKNINPTNKIVIYGLDADLIILGMTLVVKGYDIKLYREKDGFLIPTTDTATAVETDTANTNMIYFDVNICAQLITHALAKKSSLKNEIIEENGSSLKSEIHEVNEQEEFNELYPLNIVSAYVNDFVFITILLGNDFIPPCPTLNMRFTTKKLNGYELLMHTYKSLSKGEHIVSFVNNKLKVNWTLFKDLINRLAMFEEPYFRDQHANRNHKKCQSDKPADIQIFRMDHLMFRFPDPIKMYDESIPYEIRKKRYIHHYFGSEYCKCVDNVKVEYGDNVNVIVSHSKKGYPSQLLSNNNVMVDTFYDDKTLTVKEDMYDKIHAIYLGTLSYVMQYYYNECPDYMYYYKYSNSVLLSDLYEFVNKKSESVLDNIIDVASIVNHNEHVITPIVQLALVLPIKSFYLLPKNIEKLLTGKSSTAVDDLNGMLAAYKSTFPKYPIRDFIGKAKLYQATLIMNMPNVNIVKALLTSVNISSEEAERNIII